VFSREVRIRAAPSGDLTTGELTPVVVPAVLPSSCCYLVEHNLEEVGALPPLLGSALRIFILQPAAVPRQWSSRRMTTILVVGRRKPGCGLPPALSFKDVHHPC
jgi:hypothetical protein